PAGGAACARPLRRRPADRRGDRPGLPGARRAGRTAGGGRGRCMSAAARTYGVLISVALANMLQYRAVMLLWAAWGIVAPLVSLAVWTAAARGRSLAGFDRAEVAGYFTITMVVSHVTTAWDMEVFSWLVRSGQLSSRLLRPIHPVFQSAADNVAFKLCTVVVLLPIWVVIGILVRPALHLTPAQALWLLPVLGLAASLTFVW